MVIAAPGGDASASAAIEEGFKQYNLGSLKVHV